MRALRELRDEKSDAIALVIALVLSVCLMLSGLEGTLETGLRTLRHSGASALVEIPCALVVLSLALLLGGALLRARPTDGQRSPGAIASTLALGAALVGTAVLLDWHGVVYLPMGAGVSFLGLFVGIRLSMAIHARWHDHRGLDRLSGLPNSRALNEALRSGRSAHVAAAHIAGLATPTADLGPEDLAELNRQAARRLSVVSDIEELHCLSPGLFGWLMHPQASENSETTFEAARALFNAPFELGGRSIRLVPHFGRAPGSLEGAVHAASLALQRELVWSCDTNPIRHNVAHGIRQLGEFDQTLASVNMSALLQSRSALATVGNVKGETWGAEPGRRLAA